MTLSVEQIKALPNPYVELGNGDTLIEHREQLNSLSEQEQRAIAVKIISHCPDAKLNELGHAIRALRAPGSQEETFSNVISQVFEIRKRVMSLTDVRNTHPQNVLGSEFNPDLFAEFKDFSLQQLESKEVDIATKLALSTPEKDRSKLVRNAQIAFPDSVLSTKLGAAFALRREIEHHLLGAQPYNFFISPEFNPESYLEFVELFQLIEDKDDAIITNLATTPEIKRSTVLANMELLFPDSILLERTKELFKTPIKSPAPTKSIFQPSPTPSQTTSVTAVKEADAGQSLSY